MHARAVTDHHNLYDPNSLSFKEGDYIKVQHSLFHTKHCHDLCERKISQVPSRKATVMFKNRQGIRCARKPRCLQRVAIRAVVDFWLCGSNARLMESCACCCCRHGGTSAPLRGLHAGWGLMRAITHMRTTRPFTLTQPGLAVL